MKVEYIIKLFEAAGYTYLTEKPKGTLNLYYDKTGLQEEFKYSEKTTLEDVVMDISRRSYDLGFKQAERRTRSEMRLAFGIM